MAFRSMTMGYWKSCLSPRLRGTATFTTSTTPKSKPYAPAAAGSGHDQHNQTKPRPVKGEFFPVYVAIGMIALSVGFGLVTAKHQLFYSPGVHVKKKERETLPEVENPDKVVDDADKFLKKSFFRKIAHVQEYDNSEHAVDDSIRGDAFAHKPRAVTLKSVGVNPKTQ